MHPAWYNVIFPHHLVLFHPAHGILPDANKHRPVVVHSASSKRWEMWRYRGLQTQESTGSNKGLPRVLVWCRNSFNDDLIELSVPYCRNKLRIFLLLWLLSWRIWKFWIQCRSPPKRGASLSLSPYLHWSRTRTGTWKQNISPVLKGLPWAPIFWSLWRCTCSVWQVGWHSCLKANTGKGQTAKFVVSCVGSHPRSLKKCHVNTPLVDLYCWEGETFGVAASPRGNTPRSKRVLTFITLNKSPFSRHIIRRRATSHVA